MGDPKGLSSTMNTSITTMNIEAANAKEVKEVKEVKGVKEAKTKGAAPATPWAIFKERVQSVTGLPRGASRHFATWLRSRSGIAAWNDADMVPLIKTWQEAAALEPKKEKGAKGSKSKSKESESDDDDEDPVASAAGASTGGAGGESVATLEFHLLEAKKKVATATGIVAKADADAAKAGARAEEAMKVALELKVKSDKAVAEAADARASLIASQKEVDSRAAAFAALEKAAAAAASTAPPAAAESDSDPLHIKRKKIPKHIKTLVWNKYMGVDTAQADCVSCRSVKITNRSFHCGHVIAESKGGDLNINNLRPVCDACNGSMGTRSMNEFTKEFFGWTV